jgi:hypothetical protein
MSALKDGRKVVATAGTAERLVSAASSTVVAWVGIMAETDNTGTVTVGGSTVVAAQATRRGIPLAAGEGTSISVAGGIDLKDIWLDVTTNGDGVTFAYYEGLDG